MTRPRRWWLVIGFGVALVPVTGRLVQVLWMAAAAGFLALVALSVRTGRRRSQRLFVDGPNRVLATLHKPAEIDHRWDIL